MASATIGQYYILAEIRRLALTPPIHILAALLLAGCGANAAELAPPPAEAVVPAETQEASETPTLTSTEAPTPTPLPTDTPTPAPTRNPIYVLAEQGVSANAEWEPAIEEFEGVPMALVPVGCFMMGSQVFNEDERPEHEQCFDQPFWIDVYEVTNKQFGEADLECLPWSSGDDQPHICATWFEAVAHCASRGARLPTEAEWEYAARGPDGLIYPWGDDFLYENIIAGRHGNPLTVGSKPAGAAWIGALDMSGNAEEWVSSWYSPYPYDPEDGRESLDNPAGYEYRVQRGGGFLTGDPSWRIRGAYRNWFEPEFTKYTKPGFRCARDY